MPLTIAPRHRKRRAPSFGRAYPIPLTDVHFRTDCWTGTGRLEGYRIDYGSLADHYYPVLVARVTPDLPWGLAGTLDVDPRRIRPVKPDTPMIRIALPSRRTWRGVQ